MLRVTYQNIAPTNRNKLEREIMLMKKIVIALTWILVSVILSGCSDESAEPEENICSLLDLKNHDSELIFTPMPSLDIDSGEVEWKADVGDKHYEGYTIVERNANKKIVYYQSTINSKTCTYGTPLPKPKRNLEAVFFVNEFCGWVVGESGTIKRSINSGNSWTDQVSKTTEYLYDVCFINYDEGYCVGANGIILATTNGGLTWEKRTSGTTKSLYSIDFNSLNTIETYIAGALGTILYSDDYGKTWKTCTTGTSENLYGISIQNAEAIAVGANGIILARSSSNKFKIVSSGSQYSLLSVVNNGTKAFAVGISGAMLRSTDSGSIWNSLTNALRTLNDVSNLKSYPDFMMACGADGLIYYSINRGAAWLNRSINTQEDLKHIYIAANDLAIAVGTGGAIFTTSNCGIEWTEVNY